MGKNYKFRLSWLYNKLRGPNIKSKSTSPRFKPRLEAIPPGVALDGDTRNSNTRKSYHVTRELIMDPRTKHERKTIGRSKEDERVEEKFGRYVSLCSLSLSTSTSNDTSCSSPLRYRPRRPSREFRLDRVLTPDLVDKTNASSSSSTLRSLSDHDIAAVDVMVGMVSPLRLSPILTKKNKKKPIKDATTDQRQGSSKRFSLSSGMRIRVHSPRLLAASRRMQAPRGTVGTRRIGETNRRCGGFAVVKSSLNPLRDFRDSMMEMIVENRIKEPEGLEDLLVCYLWLNSEVYHDVIIAAFRQVWFDLTGKVITIPHESKSTLLNSVVCHHHL